MRPTPATLGIFARVFPVQPAADLARQVAARGFDCVQLNLNALGYPTLPSAEQFARIDLAGIRGAFDDAGVAIWGLSATYNMAYPDPAARGDLTERAVALIARAPELGVRAVSLCTGTRDADDQWRAHPDNDSASAWDDLLGSFGELLPAAARAGVLLAVEPEPANVVRDAAAALRLLDALGTAGGPIGFILDPANLVHGRDPAEHDAVLDDAFGRLGPRTICVHAKDVVPWRARLAGSAGLDFVGVARRLHALPAAVPLVVQDVEPGDVDAVRYLLLDALRSGAEVGR